MRVNFEPYLQPLLVNGQLDSDKGADETKKKHLLVNLMAQFPEIFQMMTVEPLKRLTWMHATIKELSEQSYPQIDPSVIHNLKYRLLSIEIETYASKESPCPHEVARMIRGYSGRLDSETSLNVSDIDDLIRLKIPGMILLSLLSAFRQHLFTPIPFNQPILIRITEYIGKSVIPMDITDKSLGRAFSLQRTLNLQGDLPIEKAQYFIIRKAQELIENEDFRNYVLNAFSIPFELLILTLYPEYPEDVSALEGSTAVISRFNLGDCPRELLGDVTRWLWCENYKKEGPWHFRLTHLAQLPLVSAMQGYLGLDFQAYLDRWMPKTTEELTLMKIWVMEQAGNTKINLKDIAIPRTFLSTNPCCILELAQIYSDARGARCEPPYIQVVETLMARAGMNGIDDFKKLVTLNTVQYLPLSALKFESLFERFEVDGQAAQQLKSYFMHIEFESIFRQHPTLETVIDFHARHKVIPGEKERTSSEFLVTIWSTHRPLLSPGVQNEFDTVIFKALSEKDNEEVADLLYPLIASLPVTVKPKYEFVYKVKHGTTQEISSLLQRIRFDSDSVVGLCVIQLIRNGHLEDHLKELERYETLYTSFFPTYPELLLNMPYLRRYALVKTNPRLRRLALSQVDAAGRNIFNFSQVDVLALKLWNIKQAVTNALDLGRTK